MVTWNTEENWLSAILSAEQHGDLRLIAEMLRRSAGEPIPEQANEELAALFDRRWLRSGSWRVPQDEEELLDLYGMHKLLPKLSPNEDRDDKISRHVTEYADRRGYSAEKRDQLHISFQNFMDGKGRFAGRFARKRKFEKKLKERYPHAAKPSLSR